MNICFMNIYPLVTFRTRKLILIVELFRLVLHTKYLWTLNFEHSLYYLFNVLLGFSSTFSFYFLNVALFLFQGIAVTMVFCTISVILPIILGHVLMVQTDAGVQPMESLDQHTRHRCPIECVQKYNSHKNKYKRFFSLFHFVANCNKKMTCSCEAQCSRTSG